MKVGLLTFHSAHNYGAVLQAYGTQETVKKMGVEICCIEYRPNYLIKQHMFPTAKNLPISIKLKLIVEGLIVFSWRFKRRKGFADFITSKLNCSSETFTDPTQIGSMNLDAYIMGSDQVWNIQLTKGFDAAYWGNFKTKDSALKISYAASMSNYNLEAHQKQTMGSMLRNFNSISVREEGSKQFIHDNLNIEATTVLDPTFLLDSSEWSKISKPPKETKKYVLVYCIGLRDEAMQVANSIAKQLEATVIELATTVDKRAVFNKYQSASPEEFLGLFENAACIITTSFHGTAFSIIHNKPFYSIAHGNDKDTRQSTILNKLGLIDRFIQRDATPVFQKIDYTEVNVKLEELKEASISFLKNSLLQKQKN